MGIFINIDVDSVTLSPENRQLIKTLCPVDIFAIDGEALVVRREQEDECTLCEQCLDAAPRGALVIQKTYKDERLVSRGESEQ